jgi:hypothetical protein
VPANEPVRRGQGLPPPGQTPRGPAPADPDLTLTQPRAPQPPAQPPGSTDVDLDSLDSVATEAASGSKLSRARLLSKGRPNVPGYIVHRPLGAGTYGEVWQAEEQHSGVPVAIKFFAHGTDLQWQLLQAEVQQLAQLDNVHGIIHLKDVAPDANPPYYIMALAEQGSLADRLDRGPLPPAEALAVFRQVTEALAYVHVKGIRHCDLKPGNVLLDARGRPLVADFGQAHLSSDASPALGTFFYMAPEQANLEQQLPDTRWDVYGLGALFYTMLTGSVPRASTQFRSELKESAELAHRLRCYREWVQKAPRPEGHRRIPGVDRHLAGIIDRCLEVDPDRRFRDAGHVLAALERRERRLRHRPVLAFAAAASVVLLLVVAGLGLWLNNGSVREAEQALTEQVQKSDLARAELIANAVQDQLRDRSRRLELYARDPALVAALRAGRADKLQELVADFDARNRARKRESFHRWCLTDDRGYILAVRPEVGFDRKKAYAWREWFTGRDEDQPEGQAPSRPLERLHISQPYVAHSADHALLISLSTPVRDPDQDDRILGVLMASVTPDSLHRWLSDEPQGEAEGLTVLLNDRGQCLLHGDEQEKIQPGLGRKAPHWLDSETYRAVVRQRRRDTTVYTDPVDGKSYLAGYAPTEDGSLGWGVVVQHERDKALAPVGTLRRSTFHSGLTTLAVAGLLLLAAWGGLLWHLRRGEQVAHG